MSDEASSSKMWKDLFSSSSSSDDENFIEGSDIEIESDLEEREVVVSKLEEEEKCDCVYFINSLDAIRYMESLGNVNLNLVFINCILDNISRGFNFFFENHPETDSAERVAFCDLYYRMRHELLFKFVCLTLNLNPEVSDKKFSDFGVDSNRTPDLIEKVPCGTSDEEVLIIIEVTASSSFDKGALNKGLEEAGFESKYKRELDWMDDNSIKYLYVPFIFDMSNTSNFEYMKSIKMLEPYFKINLLFKNKLKTLSESLCILTLQVSKYLSTPATILFSKIIPLKKDHNDLDFMVGLAKDVQKPTVNYLDYCVSTPVYNKITNNWTRLTELISKSDKGSKVVLFIDMASHKITCNDSIPVLYPKDYINLINNNSKTEFFDNLYIKQGNKFVKANESESGVKYTERTASKVEINVVKVPIYQEHSSSLYESDKVINMDKYVKLIENYFSNNYYYQGFDVNYEDRLISSICGLDVENQEGDDFKVNIVKSNLMFNNEISKIDIDEEFRELFLSQISKNKVDETQPLKVIKNKSPFLLPVAEISRHSYCKLKEKNEPFYLKISDEIKETDPYTSIILNTISEEGFEFIKDMRMPSNNYLSLKKLTAEISMEITKLSKEYFRSKNGKVTIPISKTEEQPYKNKFINLTKNYRELSKNLKEIKSVEGLNNDVQFIRLPTKNKGSILSSKFQVEMSHYKSKRAQSVITGIGYRTGVTEDFVQDKSIFDNITSHLTEYAGENPNLFFEHHETQDAKLLTELKNAAVNEYKNLIADVKNSFLGHASAFISNFAHSLLFYSQLPFNSDYIRVDNLGYKNALLIVRGGKKIFKNKASKLYRLIYPISDTIIPWYKTGVGMESSTKIIVIDDCNYAVTPWSQLHESILNDSISFYTRVVSFTILNLNPSIDFKNQFPKISLNVMLSFHNRRHTEVILANLRYILLATLGDFTGIMEIFDDFLGFNYDCFQSYVRGCILHNYPIYFKNLIQLKSVVKKDQIFKDFVRLSPLNLFSESKISSEEDLALMIYSTFLMTKAPYQRVAERARNLKGILEIHDYFIKEFGKTPSIKDLYNKTAVILKDDSNFEDYVNKLFNNDFNFDPNYCAQLGVFIDSYFLNHGLKDEIFTTWINILNKSWDEMATSTGLRGKFDDLSNFWGQKGYFVVYKDLIKDSSYIENVEKLIDTNLDVDSKRKLLRDLNIIYKVKIEEVKDYLIFHAVDKVQWRGGREIYVMDMETKTVQQPIEKFLGYLCQKLDNELISIPSDRRAQVIHHSIFERDLPMQDTLTWYLTLDCSKWAPKSNFIKFIPMVLSMTCLPPNFKTHFLNYTQKLYKKRIYFNTAEVDVLKNNPIYSGIVKEYLQFDEKVNGYYLYMPYSWVMGIFNYTSSFMHAVNQKYSSYLIFKTSVMSFGEETKLVMFAHSDDSGGRLTAQRFKMIKRALFHYELQLKMCNHLLSKKKSVVSRFYFEILSIIYLFKKLLALLPKFLGGLRFLPTDKGVAQDMLQSYSKSIEVMVSGASFNVAYLVMKFYSYMVFRFYYHKRVINKSVFKTPVHYLGLPDSHPLMVLLCGADSDLVRLIGTGDEEFLVKQHSFINGLVNTIEEEGPIKPIKFNISVRGLKQGFEDCSLKFSDFLKKWSVSNVNFHNTPFNFLSFLKKLNDPGFVGSLVNESTTRRLSRAYHFRKGNVITTTIGTTNLETLLDCLNVINEFDEDIENSFIQGEIKSALLEGINENRERSRRQIDLFKEILASPLKVMKYMNNLSVVGRQIVESKRTLKPTHLELIKSARTFANKFDPAQMVSYIKEPEVSWALPDIRNLISSKNEVINLCQDLGFNLDDIEPSNLLKLCRNYSGKHSKEIYMYSRVPGEIRQVRTYTSFLTFLSTNSFQDKEIMGLVLKLKSNLTDPGYVNVNMDEDIYYVNNLLSVLLTMIKVCEIDFFSRLRTKAIDLISWAGGSMLDLIDYLNRYNQDSSELVFYRIQLKYLTGVVYNDVSFSPEEIKNCAFYLFPKSQKSKGNWYGRGEILIYVNRDIYLFEIYNDHVVKLSTNVKGKIKKLTMSFILDVFSKSSLHIKNNTMKISTQVKTEFVFGIDYNGDYNIGNKREIYKGLEVNYHPALKTILDNFNSCTISLLYANVFLMSSGDELSNLRCKIYTLPLLNSEMMNILTNFLYKEDFESKLITMGLNDFEEFLLTEIMVDYGIETYINPSDFIDNFQASQLFKIFKETKEKGYSEMPKKMETSLIPAPLGSLLRILIDYTRQTGVDIIKTTNKLTPEIMEVRSQYPEHVSVILSESLIKCHKDIYDKSEIREIKESYMNLSKLNSYDEVKKNVIKLLTHWGYGALVNTIEEYSLSKDSRNFSYFSIKKWEKISSPVAVSLFVEFHKLISRTMMKHKDIYKTLEFPLPNFYNNKGVKDMLIKQCTYIANTTYGSQIIYYSTDFYHLIFINSFIAYLKDDDFIEDINKDAEDNYILCTIKFSYQLREQIVAMYNTLLYTYFYNKKFNLELDYIKKVQRLPVNIVQPMVLAKSLLDQTVGTLSTGGVHYHNFLNDHMVSFLKRSVHIYANNIDYRISQEIKYPSDKSVGVKILPLDHVYSEEFFEHENYEEIQCTVEIGDSEWEDIEDDFNGIPNKFIKSRTKKMNLKNPTVQGLITWVIDPFSSNKVGRLDKYRQCGENIAVITTTLDYDFKFYPNSHFRIVNLSDELRIKCPDMVVMISSSKYLNLEFWDKLIGGRVLDLQPQLINSIPHDSILLVDGAVGKVKSIGVEANEEFLSNFDKKDKDFNDSPQELQNQNETQAKEDEILEYKEKIMESINKAHKDGIISKRLKWRLIDKYGDKNLIKYSSLEDLFLNCMNEVNLNKINKDINEGSLEGLNKEVYVKTFLAPEHFGLSHSANRPDPKSIKNKKVKAELESLSNGFVSLIGSGSLTVSKEYAKLLKSNFKLWSNIIKSSNYKRENKKFLLILFTSIYNSSKELEDKQEDERWQSFANFITNYVADDGPEEDDNEELFELDVNLSDTARLLYKVVGH